MVEILILPKCMKKCDHPLIVSDPLCGKMNDHGIVGLNGMVSMKQLGVYSAQICGGVFCWDPETVLKQLKILAITKNSSFVDTEFWLELCLAFHSSTSLSILYNISMRIYKELHRVIPIIISMRLILVLITDQSFMVKINCELQIFPLDLVRNFFCFSFGLTV